MEAHAATSQGWQDLPAATALAEARERLRVDLMRSRYEDSFLGHVTWTSKSFNNRRQRDTEEREGTDRQIITSACEPHRSVKSILTIFLPVRCKYTSCSK